MRPSPNSPHRTRHDLIGGRISPEISQLHADNLNKDLHQSLGVLSITLNALKMSSTRYSDESPVDHFTWICVNRRNLWIGRNGRDIVRFKCTTDSPLRAQRHKAFHHFSTISSPMITHRHQASVVTALKFRSSFLAKARNSSSCPIKTARKTAESSASPIPGTESGMMSTSFRR
jgi:hypothetical protein